MVAADQIWRSGAVPSVWHIRVFAMEGDCPRVAQLSEVRFQDGGSKPEIVHRCTHLRWLRGILT